MININSYIKNFIITTDQRSFKERLLLLIASIILVYSIWQLAIFDNINNLARKISINSNKIERQISNLKGKISQVSIDLSKDPYARLQQKVYAVKKENDELEKKLDTMTETLITPQLMTTLLQDILADGDLKIISVKNLSARSMFNSSTIEVANAENTSVIEPATFQVYQHCIEIKLQGSFKQVLDFITRIEQLPTKVSWEELEFNIITYPKADIRILIGNLSVNSSLLSTS